MATALLVIYVGLSFLNDDHGFLGTDTGGKVATLRTMSTHHQSKPDVGYWAEAWDPTGELHPLYSTVKVKDQWIQVTTIPVLYAGLPLFNALGYRGSLLLPMLGSIAAAFASRALALRLGSRRPWVAFWLVGLASPLTIYALDFWEHSIGVALLLWAAVALFDTVAGGRARRPLLAGALVGAAFLLRTEALVYGAIGGATALVLLYRQRRQVRAALRFILEFGAGFVVPVVLGSALELAAVGRLLRFNRTGSAASSAGTVGSPVPGSRVSDAIATTVNLRPSLDLASYAAGAAVVAMIVIIVWGASNGRSSQPREKRVLVGFALLVGGLYVVRVSQGLGFVPGLFAAAPIAAVALALGWAPWKRRVLTAVAVGALPFIWLFQYVGGAAPQWGGRYELPTTMLLVVVGIVALESLPRWIGRSLIAVSVVITSFGVLWLGQRSHSIGDAMAKIDRLPQPALISDVGHLFREGAAYYAPERRWLTAVDPPQQDRAAEIVRLAGYGEFGFITVDSESARDFSGYRRGGSQIIDLFSDVHLRVTTYDAVSAP